MLLKNNKHRNKVLCGKKFLNNGNLGKTFSIIKAILVFDSINVFDERVAFQNNITYFGTQTRRYQWRTRRNDDDAEGGAIT